jgi:uncharacterized membrane protein YdfJ with MMPL/SSD domain
MFSSMVPLIEIGFIMGFAILIDATVVRILLVPALMSVVDRWNWWPARPPTKEELAAAAKKDDEEHRKSSGRKTGSSKDPTRKSSKVGR